MVSTYIPHSAGIVDRVALVVVAAAIWDPSDRKVQVYGNLSPPQHLPTLLPTNGKATSNLDFPDVFLLTFERFSSALFQVPHVL